MKPLHLCAAAVLLLLVAVSPALADVAPPDHKKAPKPDAIRTDLPFSHMTILPVEGLREARLQVPRARTLGRGELLGPRRSENSRPEFFLTRKHPATRRR